MQPVRITDKLSVMGQPPLGAFAIFAEKGFAAIINSRPDGEESGQPDSAA
jgi:protein tyrosine phosphatase (PTP) superfamily phosphohydrolase (DUF442 family)